MSECITLPRLELESGEVLTQVPIAYDSWGELNAERDNAVVVCHALTGNTRADVWWGPLIGPEGAFDPERYFVICMNVLGSPYGSASPLTARPGNGVLYGPDFPDVTIRDTVKAHKAVLDRLGVRGVVTAIGGSMGGMQALEWAYFGSFVRSVIPVAVGGRHSAWCIGFSEAQRQAIFADAAWNGGRYSEQPAAGLAAARMMAMISYRSRESFEDRFGREANDDEPGVYAVESYLRYQGEKLVSRFDANCYIHLTRQMDTHDVGRGRGGYEAALRSVEQPALVIGIDSDVLYPLVEQEELARLIPSAELEVVTSTHGHDAFLIEFEQMNDLVGPWLRRSVPQAPSKELTESSR